VTGAAPSDDTLREAARHRGFRLVKSRVKTPGKADYGKFGLVDADGTPVFGQDDQKFTASAQDIAEYLLKGAASTWAVSVETTPQAAATPARRKQAEPEPEPAIRPRARRRVRPSDDPEAEARPRRTTDHVKPDKAVTSASSSPSGLREKPAPAVRARKIRKATKADAAALADLIPGGEESKIAALLPAKGDNGILIAEQGGIIGVISWSLLPTLRHGLIGRITMILVADGERRRGIGRALLESAVTAMEKSGARLIEAVSDIEVRNSHGFFRKLGFEQTSYRFARGL